MSPVPSCVHVITVSSARFEVRLRGEVDHACEPDLRQALQAFEQSRARDVLIDLHEVTFIDSAGVALVVRLATTARSRRGRVSVVGCRRSVRRILDICGVGDLATVP